MDEGRASLIAMMDHRLGPALSHGHVQRFEDQLGAKMVRQRPPYDAPAENVQHHGQEHEPRLSRHVGDVGHPEPVRSLGFEPAFDQVRRRTPARCRGTWCACPGAGSPPPTLPRASAAPRAYDPPRALELPARHEPEALHRSRANARGPPTQGTRWGRHPAHRGHLVPGSVRSHELEDFPGTVPVSRANPCRGFSWNLSLLAKLAILPAQPPQLLALGARQTVLATTFIVFRLTNPVADRLRRVLELPSQLPGRAARPHQGDAHTIWRRYSGA